jgi:hypothetical protein
MIDWRNRTKSKVRAKVEHVFLVIKQIFGWAKVRNRGLAKNTNWLFIACGLTNLYLARRRLLVGGRERGPQVAGRQWAVGRSPWLARVKHSRSRRLSINLNKSEDLP